MRPKRGEVHWADLDGLGSEQQGRRPVVIVQNDAGNRSAATSVVVPLTTAARRSYPFVVDVPAGEANLTRGGYAHCEQVRVIDLSRLAGRIGTLTPQKLAEIEQALRYELDL